MFDLEKFDLLLNTEYVGRNFIYCDEIDSTNTFLLDKSQKVNINGTVILAEKQQKGKGRKDRVWYSAKGQNLTFSILLNDRKYFGKALNVLNLGSALAIAISLENLFQLKVDLKWPNDILIKGKKTAGILLESSSKGSKVERAAVGIGLNVNQTAFQGTFNLTPTSIKSELMENIEREKLLAEILNIYEEIIEKTLNSPKEILHDWKQRSKMLGEKISVSENEATKYGIFDDLDENGFLILKTKEGFEKIHFGDVSLR